MINCTDNHAVRDNCLVCGKELPPVVVRRRGRPAEHCSSNCANLIKYFRAFEKCLNQVEMNPRNVKAWRSELFSLANTVFVRRG